MFIEMDRSWNVTNARPSIGRAALSRASNMAIERLVLAGSGDDATPALDLRAQLIASEMHPSPPVLKPGRDADVAALAKPSDLVLVDRRRPPPFLFPYLGRKARRLLRKTEAPMLVVAGMPRESYRHVVIATDLQTDIAAALRAARVIAPNASFTLLHAYHALFEGKLQWAGVSETDVAQHRV